MKKASYVLIGIIIGALATYFFCPRLPENSNDKIVKPKGLITPAEAKELNYNWTKTRKKAVDSAAGKVDDRSSSWSLSDIENYLAYAKNQSDSLGYDMTGIRVYLGVYPGNAPNGKADYTTMFIVPTGKKSVSEASIMDIMLPPPTSDLPVNPLNDGSGSGDGYPQ